MSFRRLHVWIAQEQKMLQREAKSLIEAGRVKVNGQSAKATTLISDADVVMIDGQIVARSVSPVFVAFHKPRGIECTMNESIEANLLTVFDFPQRLFPVGRLDKESEGLLLMINDGRLYHKIAHADSKQEKEYYVEVHRPVTAEFLDSMRSGVKILNTITDACEVFPVESNPHAFRIILKQGMNRQIRRMSYNLGFSVHKLVRTRIMHISLGELPAGKWRMLSESEVEELYRATNSG